MDSRKRRALLADLQAQHQAINGPIAAADPALAFQLLVRSLELAGGIFARSADTTGTLLGVFERAQADLGSVALAAALSPEALAEQVLEQIAANGYGPFDTLIPSVASALGEPGLTLLDGADARIAALKQLGRRDKAQLQRWDLPPEPLDAQPVRLPAAARRKASRSPARSSVPGALARPAPGSAAVSSSPPRSTLGRASRATPRCRQPARILRPLLKLLAAAGTLISPGLPLLTPLRRVTP